jgi:predicted DNA-binding transcriptional regulator AlpA
MNNDAKPTTLLDINSVKKVTDFKSSTSIYTKMREEGFPKPISCGTRTKRWIASEVAQWIEDRIAESRRIKTQAEGQK